MVDIAKARRTALTLMARHFTPEGFEAYFELIFGVELLAHHREAIRKCFEAKEDELGMAIEMFRGAAKTTTFTIGFTTFLVGHHPDKSILLIQASDDIASDNTLQIADIIENNPAFRAVFKTIVPDKKRGWSANGYEVMDESIPYEKWRQKNAGRKDPSIVGLGYKSSSIIGKRPWALLLDDINDEKNTISSRESDKVIKILTGTIFPAANMSDWRIIIGTPWNEHDALHYCLATGEFAHAKFPVIKDGVLTWPELYDEKEIEKQKRLAGEIEFARMFLLDLEAAKGIFLKREWLQEFPSEHIDDSWSVVMGIDFASTMDRNQHGKRDEFAVAVGRLIPGGGVVLTEGWAGNISTAEAFDKIVGIASMYPTLQQVGVETNNKGQEFFELLLYNTALPVVPQWVSTSKGQRFEKELAPVFQRSRAYISDAYNPFIKKFVDQWISWDGNQTTLDDAVDAVYHMCRVTMGTLMISSASKVQAVSNPLFRHKKKESPFNSLGRR